jgi:WD40 repeat protein
VEGFQQSEIKIYSVAFSAKGDRLVSASEGGLKSWNLGVDKRAGPDTLSHHGGEMLQVVWSSNDRWIVGGDLGGSIQFWDVLDGQPQLILQLNCTFYY